MTISKIRSLKIAEWPNADREAWERACRPARKLGKGGTAAHLKPVSQKDLERRYGFFLDYIARASFLDMDAEAGAYVIPTNVDGYLAELKARLSSVTVYGSIRKLRRFVQLVAPDMDLGWLQEIEQDLDWAKQPTSKFDRIVDSDRIVQAGMTLMAEAETAHHLTPLRRAHNYRNGLMIAFLAILPIRLKNFSALRIGKNLVNYRKHWQLIIPATDNKSGRADERPVPRFLAPYLDKYVEIYRPLLKPQSDGLWVSTYGGDLSYKGCAQVVTETTRTTLGIAVSPHLMRSCAASTAYLHAGDDPDLASGLLQHVDKTVTERHYNRTRGASYGRAFSSLVEKADGSGCS
ncbi:site-specific integrase [Nordella sp. HKS 07]|uniref:site-specific integrase n=1 Tax=Nordella sp. HKS 07 TaxID=2712222 RepID=UPI0013E19887|nr:site-specific integrase [Nordella sp. HKS 07]QIG47577.1 site-specific integrase [Nordella sp. HKS 07]